MAGLRPRYFSDRPATSAEDHLHNLLIESCLFEYGDREKFACHSQALTEHRSFLLVWTGQAFFCMNLFLKPRTLAKPFMDPKRGSIIRRSLLLGSMSHQNNCRKSENTDYTEHLAVQHLPSSRRTRIVFYGSVASPDIEPSGLREVHPYTTFRGESGARGVA